MEGPDALETDFALGGPINEKTGKPFGVATKAFAEWAAIQGKPVLSHDQVDLIEQMATGVVMNDEAVALLLYGRAAGTSGAWAATGTRSRTTRASTRPGAWATRARH